MNLLKELMTTTNYLSEEANSWGIFRVSPSESVAWRKTMVDCSGQVR